jgi:hypothetical protein
MPTPLALQYGTMCCRGRRSSSENWIWLAAMGIWASSRSERRCSVSKLVRATLRTSRSPLARSVSVVMCRSAST